MLFSIRCKLKKEKGFTLLEMLVVILLVSMLSAMLMQGFIYMAGVYGVVERRQSQMRVQALFSGWLKDSIGGVVNGIDSNRSKELRFRGAAEGFEAVTLTPLSSRLYGRPHKIQWRLEFKGNSLQLLYVETVLPDGVSQEYTIKQWSGGSARWAYRSGGEWIDQYPRSNRIFDNQPEFVLPEAIMLEITGGREAEWVLVALPVDAAPYRPPEIPGV